MQFLNINQYITEYDLKGVIPLHISTLSVIN